MTEQTAEPKKRGRKPQITVTPRGESGFSDIEAAAKSAIDRRRSGDPFGARSIAIPLKEPKRWATFIANTLADENNHYKMVYELGWIPLTIHDLADGITPQSIGWQVKEDGVTLCRGQRGDEIAYKQPIDVRNEMQMRKTAENKKGIGSASALKEAAANAAAGQMGSEAADFVHKHLHVQGSDREGPLGAA